MGINKKNLAIIIAGALCSSLLYGGLAQAYSAGQVNNTTGKALTITYWSSKSDMGTTKNATGTTCSADTTKCDAVSTNKFVHIQSTEGNQWIHQSGSQWYGTHIQCKITTYTPALYCSCTGGQGSAGCIRASSLDDANRTF